MDLWQLKKGSIVKLRSGAIAEVLARTKDGQWIHVPSKDVNHGIFINKDGEPAQKANFQAVPGYEYVLTMEFSDPGTYSIVCQEYCGIGHQTVVGKIVVDEGR